MNQHIPPIHHDDAGSGAGGMPSSSIWTDRRPASRLFEPSPHRRSRAGTLPSRFKQSNITQGMGSLALVDPPKVEFPLTVPQSSSASTTPPFEPLTPARSPGLAVPQVRSRSGSMNSAAYSPFRPSIWSVERTRANTVSLAPPVPPAPLVGGTIPFPGVPSGATGPSAGPIGAQNPASHMAPHAAAPPVSDRVSIDDLSPSPTTALWVSNVPPTATNAQLASIFPNADVVVMPSKQCALVTFSSVQAADEAQRNTNGRELFPGRGPALVGFARADSSPVASQGPQSLLAALDALDASGPNSPEHQLILRAFTHRARKEIPSPPEQPTDRVYISAVLRDIRKRIDTKQLSRQEIEEIALDMLPELPTLVSDYMGNTVVQQLFEFCSDDVKDMLLRALVPHLAQAGVHKNGTWAVQKIIDVAATSRQKHMIAVGLRPYAVPLLLDQYGNYVIQCCLKFGAPYSDFVFEVIVSEISDIAVGRFGARAVRTCLESPLVGGNGYQRVVAAAIVDNAVNLSLNANGSLLVTWLLDSYAAAPHRYTVVANRITSALVQLCTSKVASLTVLKIISNRQDPTAARVLLDALFDPTTEYAPEALKLILFDVHGHGPMFLYKLLTTGFAEHSLDRHVAVNKIRLVLLQPGASPPAHKRLLEEVGLAMLLPDDSKQDDEIAYYPQQDWVRY